MPRGASNRAFFIQYLQVPGGARPRVELIQVGWPWITHAQSAQDRSSWNEPWLLQKLFLDASRCGSSLGKA